MTKLNKIDLTLIACNVALLQRPLRRLLMLSEKLMYTVYVATTSYLRCGKLFDEGANESHDRLEEAVPSTIWTLSTLKPAFSRHLKYSLFSSIKLLGLPDLPPLQQWKRNAVVRKSASSVAGPLIYSLPSMHVGSVGQSLTLRPCS